MSDRVGRAGLEAAPAVRPEAQCGFHFLVARHVERTENCGQEDARAIFRRQQLQIEAERPETRLDRGMGQRQQRCLVLVRIAVIAPRIDMRRRHDDRRIAVVFEPVDELERSLFQTRKRELVVVVFVAVVPCGDARRAAAHALRQHDDAAGVQFGDVGGPSRIGRVGRMAIKRGAIGDADKIGTERAGLGLDLRCRERLLERGDHRYRCPSSSAGAIAASVRRCCAFLNSCSCRATIPL